MRFARTVFVIAGIWGIAVLTPFYWLVDATGWAVWRLSACCTDKGRITSVDAQAAGPDGLLGLLFILAFVKTRADTDGSCHRCVLTQQRSREARA